MSVDTFEMSRGEVKGKELRTGNLALGPSPGILSGGREEELGGCD